MLYTEEQKSNLLMAVTFLCKLDVHFALIFSLGHMRASP